FEHGLGSGLRCDDEWSHAEQRVGTGRVAEWITDENRVRSSLVQLESGQREDTVRGVGDRGAFEQPVIVQRLSGRRDAERRGAAGEGGLVLWMSDDENRNDVEHGGYLRGAKRIAHGQQIASALSGLDIAQGQNGVGGARQIGSLERPLIGKWTG